MWNKYTHNPARYGRMTKADALRDFRENVRPHVIKRYGLGDRIAMREAWSEYIDGLARDKLITRWQEDNWTNPF